MDLDSLRGKKYGVEHLLAAEDGTLQSILQKQAGIQAERTQFLLSLGSIYWKEKRCLENVQVAKGDYLRVHKEPRRFPIQELHWPEALVFEDEDILVINKPSGLPVHSTVDNIQENLLALISEKINLPLHVTHRLDVATEGLLVLAKSKKAQSDFNILLMQGKVKKFYRAQVHGQNLPLGVMTHWMEPSPRAPKKVSQIEQPDWLVCSLNLLEQRPLAEDISEIRIELLTGRTHQIRAQLSAAGFPILGDHAYGSPWTPASFEKIRLQAFELIIESEKSRPHLQIATPALWNRTSSLD